MEEKTYRPPEDWQHHPYIKKLRQYRYGDPDNGIEPAFDHQELYNLPKRKHLKESRRGAHYKYGSWNPDHNMKMMRDLVDDILATGRVPTDEENRRIAGQIDEHDYRPCAELATLGMQYLLDSPDAKTELAGKQTEGEMFDQVLLSLVDGNKHRLGGVDIKEATRLFTTQCQMLAKRNPYANMTVANAINAVRVAEWLKPVESYDVQRYFDLPSEVELAITNRVLNNDALKAQHLRRSLENTLARFAEQEEEMFATVDGEVATILVEAKKEVSRKYNDEDGFRRAINDLFRANGFFQRGHSNTFKVERIFKELFPESEVDINTKSLRELGNLRNIDVKTAEDRLCALAPLLRLDGHDEGLDIMLRLLRTKYKQKYAPRQPSTPSESDGSRTVSGSSPIKRIVEDGPGGRASGPKRVFGP